MNQFDFFLFH